MDQNLFRNKQTYLDLNGPNLSFTINPSDQSGDAGENLSFVGIATASFPNNADNTGSLVYQWHEVGVGKLSDGGRLAGTATTTLTLSNIVTPGDNGRQFYVEVDYDPKYEFQAVGQHYRTGNALNEPLNSGIGSVSVSDQIQITSQPVPVTGITSTNHTFNIVSDLSGTAENISYQWQIDGQDVSDGTIVKNSSEILGTSNDVGQAEFTSSGSVDITVWTCPVGVHTVSVVCIGSGGSGTENGIDSKFVMGDGTEIIGGGGFAGDDGTPLGSGGSGSNGTANYQGGSGHSSSYGAGGGSAGGYVGNGQDGAGGANMFADSYVTASGSGGGGGSTTGHDNGDSSNFTTGAGGVGSKGNRGLVDGAYPDDATTWTMGGSGGDNGVNWNGANYGGGGGAIGQVGNRSGGGGGLAYRNNIPVVPGTNYVVQTGGGGAISAEIGSGGDGCVRIIWGGNSSSDSGNREYPFYSTGTLDESGTSARIMRQDFGNTDTTGWTIPADATDIRLDIGSGCGGSGANTHLNSGGEGGDGMSAWFTIPTSSSSRLLTVRVGRSGNDGLVGTASSGGLGGTDGGTGGHHGGTGAKSGSSGLTGSGGGGGSATSIEIDGQLAVVVGGGAGGGGASESDAGTNGSDAGPKSGSVPFYELTDTDTFSVHAGMSPSANTGSGAGGGAGGGGASFSYSGSNYSGGSAGTSGSSATGGGHGLSAYKSSMLTYQGGSYNRYVKNTKASSGWVFLTYKADNVTPPTNSPKTTTITGSDTSTLTLNTDVVGVAYTVGVKVTGTASNSPLSSDVVGYNVVSQFDQSVINIEAVGITTSASLTSLNLRNGEITFTSSKPTTNNSNVIRNYVLYSPERDINVEMEMYGGRGYDDNTSGFSQGGQGGYGKIRFTMERNVEYVLTGLSTSIGAPSLYRKASLLAVSGQGGSGGQNGGSGGSGGGVGVGGDTGSGSIGGSGGATFDPGVNGSFGSIFPSPYLATGDSQSVAPNGGIMLSCPRGIYWDQQGVSQCSDVGNVEFRLSDGSIVANTSSSITRGYKDGYNIIETAGAAVGNGGVGGNGSNGGSGGTSVGGGGGGSGWGSDSITVVESTLGGNQFNEPRVILREV